MSYSHLHSKAREAIRAGHLPLRSPDKLWGGPSTGERCAVCGDSTAPGEMALEIEFSPRSKKRRTRYHVHPLCFSIFNRELERFPGRAENGVAQGTVEAGDETVATPDKG